MSSRFTPCHQSKAQKLVRLRRYSADRNRQLRPRRACRTIDNGRRDTVKARGVQFFAMRRPIGMRRSADAPSAVEGPRCRLVARSEEHTSELQSPDHLVCLLLLEKKKPPAGYLTTRNNSSCCHCPLCYTLRHCL